MMTLETPLEEVFAHADFRHHDSFAEVAKDPTKLFGFEVDIPNEYMDQAKTFLADMFTGQASVASLKVKPFLLLKQDERTLFLQMNFAKFKISQFKELAKTETLTDAHRDQLYHWYRTYIELRDKIVTINIFLTVAMIRYICHPKSEFFDLISEGGLGLMRAVEKFDISRGCGFSTYACSAIRKAMWRHMLLLQRHNDGTSKHFDDIIYEGKFSVNETDDVRHGEQVTALHDAIEVADLTDVEREILLARFPLGKSMKDKVNLTELAKRFGYSAQGISNILTGAVKKLSEIMNPEEIAA